MYPGREVGVGIDLIWQYCESDIAGAGASNQAMPVDNSQNGENIYSGDPGFRALLVRRL